MQSSLAQSEEMAAALVAGLLGAIGLLAGWLQSLASGGAVYPRHVMMMVCKHGKHRSQALCEFAARVLKVVLKRAQDAMDTPLASLRHAARHARSPFQDPDRNSLLIP